LLQSFFAEQRAKGKKTRFDDSGGPVNN